LQQKHKKKTAVAGNLKGGNWQRKRKDISVEHGHCHGKREKVSTENLPQVWKETYLQGDGERFRKGGEKGLLGS